MTIYAYANRPYAECLLFLIVTNKSIMLSVVMLNALMLSGVSPPRLDCYAGSDQQ
jgi:hypothetical protein